MGMCIEGARGDWDETFLVSGGWEEGGGGGVVLKGDKRREEKRRGRGGVEWSGKIR